MSLADYVAKKYLTADSSSDKRTKKRKRKGNKTAHEGLLIADDDALGWNPNGQEDDADDRPLTSEAPQLSKSHCTVLEMSADRVSTQSMLNLLNSAAPRRTPGRPLAFPPLRPPTKPRPMPSLLLQSRRRPRSMPLMTPRPLSTVKASERWSLARTPDSKPPIRSPRR